MCCLQRVVGLPIILTVVFVATLSQKSQEPDSATCSPSGQPFDNEDCVPTFAGVSVNVALSESKERPQKNNLFLNYADAYNHGFGYQSYMTVNTSIANALTNSSLYIAGAPTTASEFLRLILPVMETIVSLPENQLHPNPLTNSLFTTLVNLICLDHFREAEIFRILSNHDILRYQHQLMQQCSSAEYFLEADYARQIQSGTKSIEEFLYYDNYVSLVQFEMDSLKTYAENISISRAVVIGSGPLPLTSVEMLKHLSSSAVVINYDHSEEALELARIVVKKIERTFVEHRTALEISADDLNQVDLVYLAALVGIDKTEKEKILEHLYDVMKPGSILVARSAIGLKTLVYRRLTTDEFGKFSNIQEFHPRDKRVLNSIMCATR